VGRAKSGKRAALIQPFTDIYQGTLLHRVDRHMSHYLTDARWALRGHKDATTKAGVMPAGPLDLKMPTEGETFDLENSIQLHRAFPNLTRTQACDQGFWARLCHVECWEYMRRRWDASTKKKNKRSRYVAERYFVPRAQSRCLMRNGIARLWWAAYLTCDPANAKNQYELTAVLLRQLDITKNLLERSYGRSDSLLKCALRFLAAHKDDLLVPGNVARRRCRVLFRRLNSLGGVGLLDTMTDKAIVDYLEQELKDAISKEGTLAPKKSPRRRKKPKGR
jgi:hypothetical protein